MTIQRWNIDTSHSNLDFVVRHLVVSKVRGTFTKWGGSIDLDSADPTNSSVTATIEVSSIDTREEKRDGHLKSPDFFDAEKFPTVTFASSKVTGGGDKYEVTGPLTIHGVAHDVTLHVETLGQHKDPWGNQRVVFSAKTSINRKDFGMTWSQTLETGGLLVGEKVEIEIEVQAVKAQPAA